MAKAEIFNLRPIETVDGIPEESNTSRQYVYWYLFSLATPANTLT